MSLHEWLQIAAFIAAVLLLVATALVAYLIYALVRPEKF